MRFKAGDFGTTAFGETFGPLEASDGEYSLPLYAKKNGQTYTFHVTGRYSTDPTKRHILDLVPR